MQLRSRNIGGIPHNEWLKTENSKAKTSILDWKPKRDNIVLNFFRESTLHGFKYLGKMETHICERIFWVISLVTLSTIAFIFVAKVVNKYYESPMIVSYQPFEISLEDIPYPAITICNINNIRKSTVDKVHKQFDSTANGSKLHNESLEAFQLIDHICNSYTSFSSLFNFSAFVRPEGESAFYENYFQNDAFFKVHENNLIKDGFQNCSEMILLCIWMGVPINCTEIFRPIYTDMGPCCSFNLMPIHLMRKEVSVLNKFEDDSDEHLEAWKSWNIDEKIIDHDSGDNPPQHERKAGLRGALSVLLYPEIEEYYCPSQDSLGFRLLAGNVLDYPKVLNYGIGIPPDAETFVDLTPQLTMADKSVYDVPYNQRQCYFSGRNEFELHYYNVYTIKNCVDECVSNLTSKRCKCVKPYMPRHSSQKICGDVSDDCFTSVKADLLHRGISENCSVCLPSCTQIHYAYSVSSLPMYTKINIWEDIDGNEAPWTNKSVSIVHVYLGSDSVYSRVRQKMYDFSTLLANTGGVLGLYLGFSFVSALEILYHFLFKPLFQKTDDGQYSIVQKWNSMKRHLGRKLHSSNGSHSNRVEVFSNPGNGVIFIVNPQMNTRVDITYMKIFEN